MKENPLILAVALCLFGCGPSDKRADIIAAHEQVMGNTKIDLNLKVKEIEDVGVVKATDSLLIHQEYFNAERDKKLQQLTESLEEDKGYLADAQDELKKAPSYLKDIYAGRVDRYKTSIETSQNAINLYNTDCKGTFLEGTYNKIKELEGKQGAVLANKVRATYTIVNPLLNNAKQEITNLYYFTPDNNQIIRKETPK